MPKKLHPAQMAILALIALVVVMGLIALIPPNKPSAPAAPVATMDPTIVFNLTQLPDMPPFTGDEAQKWADFQAQITACTDYSPQKRSQMDRYISWMINPSQIPPELTIMFGADIRAGLIRAMAADTSTDWRLKQRPAGSCLITIGRELNNKLVETGQAPLTIYDE
jgi:hypothetical protein